jgi:EAL domain-containing protein (putative c-di-GMP-specific phosphodiesterase class I)
MVEDENDAVIVRSTIDLARNLGLCVVAEGVETAEVMDALAALECDIAQGYFISRPLPAQELSVSLRGPARKPSASSADS